MKLDISSDVRSLVPELVSIRRAIHRYPEPGFQEHRTQGLIRDVLRKAGVEARSVAGTGVIALVRGAKHGRTLLVRADMDGLPIAEENDVPYRSKTPGFMHA